MMRLLRLFGGAALAALLASGADAACVTTLNATDAGSTSRAICFGAVGATFVPFSNIVDSTGANIAGVNASGQMSVIATQTGTWTVVQGAAGASPWLTSTSQINGTTTLTGAGAVGAGAQRVAVGQDTTTIAGSAPGTAGTASANVITVQGIASGTVVPVSGTVTANAGTGTLTTSDTTHFPATAALSDALSNPTVSGIGAYNLGWDATNSVWRRAQVTAGTGSMKVDGSGVTQPVSGTVTATQATGSNLHIACDSGCEFNPSFGAALAATGVPIGAEYLAAAPTFTTGNMVPLQTDINGNLNINCGGKPCLLADEAAFTQGTTGFSTIGGYFNTNANVTNLTAGQVGAVRMDAARYLLTLPGMGINTLATWAAGTTSGTAVTVLSGNSGTPAALVQLDQGIGISAGQINFDYSNDGGVNWSNGIDTYRVIDPTSGSGAIVPMPYNLVASTNKAFLIDMDGYNSLRIRVSVATLGGSVTVYGTGVPYRLTTSPQVVDIAQYSGSVLGTPTNYGTAPASNTNAMSVNAFVTNTANVAPTQGGTALSATNGGYQNILQGNVILSATNPIFTEISDGTRVNTIKAGSTASVAGDTSLVVQLNPAQPNLTTGLNVTASQATGTNLHIVCDSGCSATGSPTYGATFPTTGTPIGAEYLTTPPTLTNNTLVALQTDIHGNLNVDCGGNPCNPSDESAFTQGTSGYSPIGGFYNTNANVTALTTGQAGALRLDTSRYLLTAPGMGINNLATWAAATTSGTAVTVLSGNAGANAALVQLDQGTGISAGAITFDYSNDGGANWSSGIDAYRVLDPTSAVGTTISLPYTLVASTNKAFLINMNGYNALRIRVSTTTAGGSVTVYGVGVPYPISTFTQAINIMQAGGTNLGAPSNYGTSPGTVAVLGVNAFVTNTASVALNATPSFANGNGVVLAQGGAVLSATNGIYTNLLQGNAALSGTNPIFSEISDGTRVNTIKAASTASVAADTSLVVQLNPTQPNLTTPLNTVLTAGSATIGAVTQASGPWTSNVTQINGSALNLGQTTMSASIPVTLASNQSALTVAQATAANLLATVSEGGTWVMTGAKDSGGTDMTNTTLHALQTTAVDVSPTPATANITAADVATTSFTGYGGSTYYNGSPAPTANSASSLAVSGQVMATITVSGTWNATLQFETSADGGTTWVATSSRAGGLAAILTSGSSNNNGIFEIPIADRTNVRVRATAYTSGTATIKWNVSTQPAAIAVNSPVRISDGVSGANISVKAASTAALATDPSGVVQLSPNQPVLAGLGVGVTGSAPPANAMYAGVNTGNLNTGLHVCGSFVFKHITTATDTQIVAASGATNIYICDFEFSAAAAQNFFFEKSSSGTCATPTQIGPLWTLSANEAKVAANAFYRGFSTGASQQLCVNTSAAAGIDIGVYYDQY